MADAYRYVAGQPGQSGYQLARERLAERALAPHEVRVRVHAVSLNYRDLVNRDKLAGRVVDGRVPCSDVAGEVVEIGSAVQSLKPGDRVAANFFQGWSEESFDLSYHKSDLGGSIDGMLAEEVVLHETGLLALPDYLSFEQAACLPCAGLTAWYSLVERGRTRAKQTVLTLGTGGVSVFAIQIAQSLGCEVFVTSSSDDKLARAKSLGAKHTINYRANPDWEKLVWQETQRVGVDHIIEVGGPGTLEKSVNCVASSGNIYLIGVLTGFGSPTGTLFPLMARNATLHGIYVGGRPHFQRMLKHFAEHQIQPVIDRVFSFDQAPQAFDYLKTGAHFGKVVIKVG